MVLKAFKEELFEANVILRDSNETKRVTFRLPKQSDFYVSADNNVQIQDLRTACNMSKPFTDPVEVELPDGTIENVFTLQRLYDLGISLDITDVLIQWGIKYQEAEKKKEKLVKKSLSAGSSTKKATNETKD